MLRLLALGALLVVLPVAADAGDVVVGLGYADFSDDRAENSAILELELHSDPIWHFFGADWSLATAIVAHSEGDYFIGVGPSARWPLRNGWFVEASAMPGYFNAAEALNDLGGNFEIRTLLGIGRQISDRLSVSLAATHKSNANTADRNPGVNAVAVRARWSF